MLLGLLGSRMNGCGGCLISCRHGKCFWLQNDDKRLPEPEQFATHKYIGVIA
jgi:hypothetical protein